MKMISNSEIQGMALVITITKVTTGALKETVEANMNGNKMVVQKKVFDGKKGYEEQQGQKKDLKADDIEDLKQEADLQSDLHPEKYGIKRTLTGIETIEGADAYTVDAIDAKNKKTTEYYDIKTGYKVREIQYIKSEDGTIVPKTTDYSDYREVPGANGYKIPYFFSIPAGPGVNLNIKVQSVDINKQIPDSEFQ